jgi:hypothetical protein
MNIPFKLLDTVTYIEVFDEGEGEYKQIGTGFFVNHLQEGYNFNYMVTCFHVIKGSLDNNEKLYARINAIKEGGVIHVPLEGKWNYSYLDENNLVDIAVFSIEPIDDEMVDDAVFYALPSKNIFRTSEMALRMALGKAEVNEMELKIGDDIIFIGLFENYPGHYKNSPIVRFGKISLITGEGMTGVRTWLGVSEYFLVESQCYPRMSGSPVFLVEEREDKEEYLLVGVMAGYFREEKKVCEKFTHYGISQVIPISRVGEIIFSRELENVRYEKIRDFLEKVENEEK